MCEPDYYHSGKTLEFSYHYGIHKKICIISYNGWNMKIIIISQFLNPILQVIVFTYMYMEPNMNQKKYFFSLQQQMESNKELNNLKQHISII